MLASSGLLLVIAGCGGNTGSSHSGPANSTAQRPMTELSHGDVDVAKRTATATDDGAEVMDADSGSSTTTESSAAKNEGKPFEPSSGRQSGLLTAGSFDDVANFSDYMAFLRRHQHLASQCQLPLNSRTQQTVIEVTNSEGRPLGNLRCIVREPQTGRVLLDRRTGTDGRVMLLTQAGDNPVQQPASVQLQVFADAQQQTPAIDERREIDGRWTVTIDSEQSALPSRLDLALVVDTTGSMGDELEYLKTEIDSIVASVNRMFPQVSQRYSLITYRDKGDQYVCRSFDFTESLSDFRRNLDAQSADGGGDFPEAMDVALSTAGQLNWRAGNTARVLFLVGDAPPHAGKLQSAIRAVHNLGDQGIRVFPVGASGVESTAEVVMRTASLLTMGQYLFLTDHSGVGNPHATPDVPEFAVERLDRLMIRMIASELAGKRLVAEEVIAIEQGEFYSNHVPQRLSGAEQGLPVAGIGSTVNNVQSVALSEPVGLNEPAAPYESVVRCAVTTVDSRAFVTVVFEWLSSNALASFVTLIAGVFVFDRLTKLQGKHG